MVMSDLAKQEELEMEKGKKGSSSSEEIQEAQALWSIEG